MLVQIKRENTAEEELKWKGDEQGAIMIFARCSEQQSHCFRSSKPKGDPI